MTGRTRDYQVAARHAVWREFDAGTTATLVVMPTGTGKTHVAADSAATAKARGRRTLFLAHRDVLVAQAFDTLSQAGLDVGIEMGQLHARDGWGTPDVVVGTVQSFQGDRLASWDAEAFGHIISDECHRAAAPSHRAVCARFPAALHLGITATPEGASGRIGEVFRSMAYQYTMRQALADGWIVRPVREQCEIPISLANIRSSGGDFHVEDLADRIGPSIQYIADAIKQRVADRYFVAFVPGVGCAQALAAALRAAGPSGPGLDCRYAAGSGGDFGMGRREKQDVLAAYNAMEVRGIICSDLLFEGWDAPHCSDVVVARPTTLRYRYQQMVGRILRPFEGKLRGTIIDFDWRTDGTSRDLVSPAELFACDDPDLDDMDPRTRAGVVAEARKLMARGQQDPLIAVDEAKDLVRRRRDIPVLMTGVKADFAVKITDPIGLADVVGVKLGRHDTPGPQRETARPWQVARLAAMGAKGGDRLSYYGAHKMLAKLEKRAKDGLAAPEDLARLRDLGVGELTARSLSATQARRTIANANASATSGQDDNVEIS